MKTIYLTTAAALAVAMATPAAAAQFTFNFVTSTQLFGAGPLTGSGVFTTTDVATMVGGRSALAITSISGMVNGSAIIAPTGSYGNYFTSGATFLDGSGLRFFTAAGNDVRFFFQDTVSQYRVNTFSPGASAFVTASSAAVAAVPEPAGWAMMLAGFGLLGGAMRYRRNATRVAFG